jgi:hypothetical protein
MDTAATLREPADEQASELYLRLLGASWTNLAAVVRWAHTTGGKKRGRFCVTHGDGWLARRLVCRARLPQVASDAETSLKIIADEVGETWERSFNGEKFTTLQWETSGTLAERFGSWELRFVLRVKEGALLYEQCGASFCVGRLRLPLPRACAPFVEAREWADNAGRARVVVKVTFPVIGLLIAYDGHLFMEAKSS